MVVHGSRLILHSSPIYAYLQKAALTLRLILEALPIPSRRHRLRVWVTYLSIKVLLRRSPGWVSTFFHKILTTLILNLFPYLRSCHLGCQLLNISIQCQFIQQSLLTSLPLSTSTSLLISPLNVNSSIALELSSWMPTS